jgi:hypothetical protein
MSNSDNNKKSGIKVRRMQDGKVVAPKVPMPKPPKNK